MHLAQVKSRLCASECRVLMCQSLQDGLTICRQSGGAIAAATKILAVARKFPTVAASVRLIDRAKRSRENQPPARGISLAVERLERARDSPAAVGRAGQRASKERLPRSKTLLEAASTYAAGRLAEFEARAHYVHEIHTRE